MRRGLEPIALKFGLEMSYAMFATPTTPEARTLDAYRIGQSLLMFLGRADAWPTPRDDGTPKRARKLAKAIYDSVADEAGRRAVVYMTEGYGRETAALWRRAADSGACDDSDADLLRENARRSEELAELAAGSWPYTDPYGALAFIESCESERAIDLDDADVDLDLRAYYGRARVACGAAALALGPELKKFEDFIAAPILSLDVQVAAGLGSDWNFNASLWSNLLRDDPLPYAQAMQSG